jgi:uncharacterized protein (TIGR03435 family)
MTTDDMALVRQYATEQSENAFATLVSRHASLVYSAALRRVRDPQLAEEITQAVFVILARKAGSLNDRTILPGWLYRTACYASNSALKQLYRRQWREREAFMQSTLQETGTDAAWRQMSPLLEEAMLRLSRTDRNALVLRFFEGRTLSEVGTVLGVSEDAAKKRVNRALEKLLRYFKKQGVSSTAAIIAGVISANSVQVAPEALAKSVTVVALAKGAAAGGSTLTLTQGALKLMAWTKVKLAVAVGASLLLAGGAATVTMEAIRIHSENVDAILTGDFNLLVNAPPMLVLRPTRLSPDRSGTEQASNGNFRSRYMSAKWLLAFANDFDANRTIIPPDMEQKNYDVLFTLQTHSKQALRDEIKRRLGLVTHREIRPAEVLVLELERAGAPGIQSSQGEGHNSTTTGGPFQYALTNWPVSVLGNVLESRLGTKIEDRTGLRGRYDITFHWDPTNNPDAENAEIKQAMRDQLGLELVPTNIPVEMLVVEKAN